MVDKFYAYFLKNYLKDLSKGMQMKFKTLIALSSLSASLSFFFLLIAVFILNDVVQSSILLAFIFSTLFSLFLIKTKGLLKAPAIIVISFGYLLLTALYFLNEQQTTTIAIWYLLYLLLTNYFLGTKKLIYVFFFTVLMIVIKVFLVNENLYLIPLLHPGSIYQVYYEAAQVLSFLLIFCTILAIIINNTEIGQEETEQLLNNREVLVKEIHHRVKNNLQIIYSLLELQKNKYNEESHLEILNTASGRISSMALIHEMLYESDDLSSIDLSDYTNRLCTALSDSNCEGFKIKNTSKEISNFNPDVVIPYGLIINELVTNSFKYAKGIDKKITILIEDFENNTVKISYSDNGELPVSNNLFTEKHNSLGIKIITSLIKQIRGTISQIPSQNGFNAVIQIPITSKKDKIK